VYVVCFPFYRFNLQSDLHQCHVTGFHILKENRNINSDCNNELSVVNIPKYKTQESDSRSSI